MLTLLKNANIVCGDSAFKQGEVCDLLLAGGKIVEAGKRIDPGNLDIQQVDLEGRFVAPGLVDGHVHFIGAAGDETYTSKTPEIFMSHFMRGGVTTAVGCLGFGHGLESVEHLYVKAQALRADGLSTYIYTGAFYVPSPSITKSAGMDIALFPYVIGVKIAIADPCSSVPSVAEFARASSEAWAAGLQSGKSGAMQVHVGFHGDPFEFLMKVHEESGIPLTQFIPTHCNWSDNLVALASGYAKKNGYVDYSTILDGARGSLTSVAASKAVQQALSAGAPLEKLSLSSDGNVGMPIRDENKVQHGLYLERVGSLWHEVRALIEGGLELEKAVSLATVNPARRLGLYPQKGIIKVGSDADLIVLNEKHEIERVYVGGKLGLEGGKPKLFSHFEKDIIKESLEIN